MDLAGGRVLDVGVGTGRHALALQASGKDVVGLDPSPGAVEVARQRGVDARLGSIAAPPADIGRFDALLLLGNNLGLLQGPERAPEVLAHLASLARPGALLIGTGMDPSTADADHRAYQERNRRAGRLPGQIRMRNRQGVLATDWFDYLLAGVDDLRALVRRSPSAPASPRRLRRTGRAARGRGGCRGEGRGTAGIRNSVSGPAVVVVAVSSARSGNARALVPVESHGEAPCSRTACFP
ncbi:class I SAM-dependent methyltransferase [Nocardiopsis sp. NPDC006198]|uniref:class I SAM-dependent methyltransferase n=1 Tax=Nocardiopsis sp. NPDC006198 TaxID=3154472 RepID=UPI0033B75DB6